MNEYLAVLKKYAEFSGRATRKEYWMFTLVNAIVFIILMIAEYQLGLYNEEAGGGMISSLYNLAVLLPSLAVSVRRMHDVNKSGWFILVPIYSFILTVTGGTKGQNRFGADPYGRTSDEVVTPGDNMNIPEPPKQ